jgi:hypothetical protein
MAVEMTMTYKDAKRSRFITFYGGPNDGITELVDDKEIYVGSYEDVTYSWTWIKSDKFRSQENRFGLAGYDVIGDVAVFTGMC